MIIGYVYMITSITGKIYIGSTKNIVYRWNNYKKLNCKTQIKLYRSLLKYGVNNHKFEILWNGDINSMYKYERLYGNYYEVLDNKRGMNLRLPGYDEIPPIISKESRIKMSNSGKIKVFSEKHKENLRISATNRKVSLETRVKMSKSHEGKTFKKKIKAIVE